MKIKLTLLFIFIAAIVSAQTEYDAVFLKDGSIYKGNVTEYIPNKHVILKLLDGRIITVVSEDISGLSVGDKTIIKRIIDIKKKGYFHNSLIGPQFGNSVNGTKVSVAYHMLNGYILNNHRFGAGLGLENYFSYWYTPVYADYTYRFLKGRFSPFAGVNGGYMAALQKADDAFDQNYQKGATMGFRIGFTNHSSEKMGFIFSIGYRYIWLNGSHTTRFDNRNQFLVENSAQIPRINFMFGFLIN